MLKKLNMIKDLNIKAWVNDSYVRQAYKDLGLDYDKQLATMTGYEVTGHDPCLRRTGEQSEAGRSNLDRRRRHRPVQLAGLHPPGLCKKFTGQGKKLDAVYLVDHDAWASSCSPTRPSTRSGKDPEEARRGAVHAQEGCRGLCRENGGKFGTYADALATINVGQ